MPSSLCDQIWEPTSPILNRQCNLSTYEVSYAKANRDISPDRGDGSREPTSPMLKKQRTFSTDDSLFPYPNLPAACVTSEEDPPLPPVLNRSFRDYIIVPSKYYHTGVGSLANPPTETTSLEWGDAATATRRACIEPEVTEGNRELFRTHHPSLSSLNVVRLFEEEPNHNLIWLVGVERNDHYIGTHAGGIGIHIIPRGLPRKPVEPKTKWQDDPLSVTLNPRKFLARNHLHLLRKMLPTSLGVRVFVSGFVVALFKDRAAVEHSWQHDGILNGFGNLRICYDILDKISTKNDFSHDLSLVTNPKGLPEMEVSDRTPCIVRWGSYEALSAGAPAFMAACSPETGNPRRQLCKVVSREAQKAIHEGSQYIWNKQHSNQTVSILWRTRDEEETATGFTGSILCLGKPDDGKCLAVCMQNFEFEAKWPKSLLSHLNPFSKRTEKVMIKGGFLLSDEIRDSEILCYPCSTPPTLRTFPSRPNPKEEGLRKSCSIQ